MKKLIFLISLLLPLAVFSGTLSIDWFKVAGGGGASSNGNFTLSGTIGQQDASGPMTGSGFALTGGFWSLFALQTPGGPLLSIKAVGTNAVLYWSAAATGYKLEINNNLKLTNNWTAASPLPTAITGTNYVTNGIVPGNNFYRLRNPGS
jgi:hypothetical protein